MNHCGTQRLETERLVLRRLAEADAEAVYRNWASDPEVTRFLTWPAHTSPEVTKHIIGTWLPLYGKKDYYHWGITLKEYGNEPIGTIHGLVNDDLELVQIGYCLGRAWWNRGIMSEAAQAVIGFFFDRVNANSICSYHDPGNPHSGMVMKHCGMKYEGTRRAADRNNTGICDASWYSVLRPEYRTANNPSVKEPQEADRKITEFLIRAKRATYAGKGAETAASRTGSHDLVYREGGLMYYDTYLGGDRFAGEEALWIADAPYWSMNYAGRVTGGNFSGDFLKEALLHVPEEKPFRGPREYTAGDYAYRCETDGSFDWFQGKETIAYRGEQIYECFFHGGMIR